MRGFVGSLLILALLAMAGQAADMDKLLTGNMEGYSGKPPLEFPTVDVAAKGKTAEEALKIVYGGRRGPGWKAGEEVDIVIDLRAERIVKTVHVRFGGDISGVKLSYSVDKKKWHPMDAVVSAYPRKTTWYEAVDYAVPARYVRLSGTVNNGGLSISDTRVYGAETIDEVDLVDGVYASAAPAVAGTKIKLNVVIANTSTEPMNGLKITIVQANPKAGTVGRAEKERLDPGRSVMFTLPWEPVEPERHKIVVETRWTGEGGAAKESKDSFTLPVVNRKLWFGSTFRWATFEGPTYINFSTPYYEEDDPGQIRLLRRRGGLYLRGVSEAGHGTRDPEALRTGFIRSMDDSDGIGIDEYTDSDPKIIPINVEALKRARAARPDKVIAPWTHGGLHYLKLFQTTADVVLIEGYMTIYGPKVYEDTYGKKIDYLRKYGMADRSIMVQGIFGGQGKQMTAEDLENSVRFVKHHGPEVPGMAFYGGWVRGPWAEHYAMSDKLCYTYFIAPVITQVGEAQTKAGTLKVTLRNVGGMNAHGVRVAAFEPGTDREIGRSGAISIPVGGTGTAVVRLARTGKGAVRDFRISPSKDYTVLRFVSALGLYAQQRAEAGGIGAERVGYLSGDRGGIKPVPYDTWRYEDDTPEDSRDDYVRLTLAGNVHPSVVLDLGRSDKRPITRIRCRGYPHFAKEEQRTAFLKSLRLLESNDNVTYKPVAAGYKARWDANPLLWVIDGLRTRARYIKINCTYEGKGKGYWVPKAPDDLDNYYAAGDGGLIGWDVYLEQAGGK